MSKKNDLGKINWVKEIVNKKIKICQVLRNITSSKQRTVKNDEFQ